MVVYCMVFVWCCAHFSGRQQAFTTSSVTPNESCPLFRWPVGVGSLAHTWWTGWWRTGMRSLWPTTSSLGGRETWNSGELSSASQAGYSMDQQVPTLGVIFNNYAFITLWRPIVDMYGTGSEERLWFGVEYSIIHTIRCTYTCICRYVRTYVQCSIVSEQQMNLHVLAEWLLKWHFLQRHHFESHSTTRSWIPMAVQFPYTSWLYLMY